MPHIGVRVEQLLSAHFNHPQLARSAAYECETGKVDLSTPSPTKTFTKALYYGAHFPVQACMYVKHRARLYIMKALVDYWLARDRGEIEEPRKGILKAGGKLILPPPSQLSNAMEKGIKELSAAKSFRSFPVFWQVFLWSWGGFLLKDRLDEEYAELERETGVPAGEIDIALSAFDKVFPVDGGWFKDIKHDSRRVLMLMPAVMRGIGAYRRMVRSGVERYQDLAYMDATNSRLIDDHNSLVRLLDSPDEELVK